jgi:thioredoxin-like negative regulator of GroEL
MSVIAYSFWSPTCGPCKNIKPALAQMAEDFPAVKWESINTQEDTAGTARTFRVQAVPTVVVTKNGVEVGRHSGTNVIMYYSLLRKAIAV